MSCERRLPPKNSVPVTDCIVQHKRRYVTPTPMESDSDSRDLVPAESASLPAIETRRPDGTVVPAIVAAAGDKAARRFLEFFAVTIDNPNTRAAYYHACRRFFDWCDRREDIAELVDIEPM